MTADPGSMTPGIAAKNAFSSSVTSGVAKTLFSSMLSICSMIRGTRAAVSTNNATAGST